MRIMGVECMWGGGGKGVVIKGMRKRVLKSFN